MSEMKLIMEGWRGFINEEPEVTVGQFVEAFAKYMPGYAQKILGSKLFKIALGGTLGLAAGVVAAPGVATVGGLSLLGGTVVSELFGKIANAADPLGKIMADMARKQVPDNQRAGLDNYYDIDDSYENLIGGMRSPVGEDFAKELQMEYTAAFTKFKDLEQEAEARGEDASQLLGLPLTAIGITKSASELFQNMVAGEEDIEPSSMGGEKVQVQTLSE